MAKFKEPFVTTVNYNAYLEFAQRSILLSKQESSLLGEINFIPQLVRATGKAKLFLLDSTSGKIHPDVLATILIRLLPRSRRPVIVFMGAMWQRDEGIKGLMQKVILRLADGAIARYAVQSTDEVPLFASAWGISESKMRFVPYIFTFTDKDLSLPAPTREGFIFAGGNSHRDYDSFIEAINSLREYKFIIATYLLEGKTLPPNVKSGPVPREEFIRLMRAADAVVVPMKKGLIRAVGQQTYLNAMMLGKPTIVSNALGVMDHVQNGRTAIVVNGEPDSYVQAIRKVMDPSNKFEIDKLCQNAREVVLNQFTFEKHVERLLEILDEAAGNY